MNKKEHELYQTWKGIKQRCYNKNSPSYQYYGAKGIKMCDRWKNEFYNFVEDMGQRPNGHTIDRIDNNGNYEPNNCKWSNATEQGIHRKHLPNRTGYQYIFIKSNGYYYVELQRYNTRRRSKQIKTLDDALKLRDEWLTEWEQDYKKWVEDTKNKNYSK